MGDGLLEGEDGGGANAEFVQAQAHQQLCHTGVSSHLAAHGDGLPRLSKASDRSLKEAKHRRRKRLVIGGNGGIQPVRGAQVLAKIICTDGGEIGLHRKLIGQTRRREDLNHDAQGDLFTKGQSVGDQRRFGLLYCPCAAVPRLKRIVAAVQ